MTLTSLLREYTTVLSIFLEVSARTHSVSGTSVTELVFDASETSFGWHSKRIGWNYSTADGEPPLCLTAIATCALYSHLFLGQETRS